MVRNGDEAPIDTSTKEGLAEFERTKAGRAVGMAADRHSMTRAKVLRAQALWLAS